MQHFAKHKEFYNMYTYGIIIRVTQRALSSSLDAAEECEGITLKAYILNEAFHVKSTFFQTL